MISAHDGIERHEGVNGVAEGAQVAHQRTGDIRQAPGFRVRHDLRTQNTQLQCRHALQFNKHRRNLVQAPL
jgi:heme-degrading monooxygenase HmoA